MMDRRAFLVGAVSLLAAPRAADAQPAGRVARVGVLASSTEANFGPSVKVFREALRAIGWVEGRNLTLDVRYPGEQSPSSRSWRPSWSGSKSTCSQASGLQRRWLPSA